MGEGSINSDSTPMKWYAFHPNSTLFGILVLVSVCFLTFGSYFCYDIPGALTTQIEDQYYISSFQYEWLYAVYSFPNAVTPFFGGWFLDSLFGLRFGACYFCALVMAGQFLFALYSYFPNPYAYWGAIVGRIIFGLGGESLSVAQSTYCAKWFSGKALALSFGITLSFARLGSAINFLVTPRIEAITSVSTALWIGAAICFISMGACLVLSFLDGYGEKVVGKKKVMAGDEIKLSDVFSYPIEIWMIYAICDTFYVAVFSFITIGSSFFQYHYGLSPQTAGTVISIPYVISAIICPFCGLLVDRVGRSILFVTFASALIAFAHFFMAFMPGSQQWVPVVGMIIVGVAYSFCAASLWPAVALIIEGHKIGTAYGLMTALQNAALAVAPLVIGLLTNDDHYTIAISFLGLSALTAFFLGIILSIIDLKRGLRLNASGKTIKARMKKVGQEGGSNEQDAVTEQSTLLNTDPNSLAQPYDFGSDTVQVPPPKPRSLTQVRYAYMLKIGISPDHIPGSR